MEVNEEGRPAVIEVLCDECETALNFEDFDDARAEGNAADARRPLVLYPSLALGFFPVVAFGTDPFADLPGRGLPGAGDALGGFADVSGAWSRRRADILFLATELRSRQLTEKLPVRGARSW